MLLCSFFFVSEYDIWWVKWLLFKIWTFCAFKLHKLTLFRIAIFFSLCNANEIPASFNMFIKMSSFFTWITWNYNLHYECNFCSYFYYVRIGFQHTCSFSVHFSVTLLLKKKSFKVHFSWMWSVKSKATEKRPIDIQQNNKWKHSRRISFFFFKIFVLW